MNLKVSTNLHSIGLLYAFSQLASFDAASLEGAAASRAISKPSEMEESQSRVEERMFPYTKLIEDVEKLAQDIVEVVPKAATNLYAHDVADTEKSVTDLFSPHWSFENDEYEEAALLESWEYSANPNKKARTTTEANNVLNSKEMAESSQKILSTRQDQLSPDDTVKLANWILEDPTFLRSPLLKNDLDRDPEYNYKVLSVTLEKTYSHETEILSNLLKEGGDVGMKLQENRLINWNEEFDPSIASYFVIPDPDKCLTYLKSNDLLETIRYVDVFFPAPYKFLLRELKNKLGFVQLAQLLLDASKDKDASSVGETLEMMLINSWFEHCTQEQVRELLQLQILDKVTFFKSPVTRLYLLYITKSSLAMQTDCLNWLSKLCGGVSQMLLSAAKHKSEVGVLLFRLQKKAWTDESLFSVLFLLDLGTVKFVMHKDLLFEFWVRIATERDAMHEAVSIVVTKAIKDHTNIRSVELEEIPYMSMEHTIPETCMRNAANALVLRLAYHTARAELNQYSVFLFWTQFLQGMAATEGATLFLKLYGASTSKIMAAKALKSRSSNVQNFATELLRLARLEKT